MSEPKADKKTIGKADARYWKQKGKLIADARSRFFCCKIQAHGRRESFPLRTANKSVAAAKAAEIFGDVSALGWEAALAKHKPVFEKPLKMATVGEYIEAVSRVAEIRPHTLADYIRAFRRIAADVTGIKETASRYAAKSAGKQEWLAAVHAVPLDELTPGKIQAWKLAFVAKVEDDKLKARSAKISANSLIRMARSLFSEKKVLRHIGKTLVLPDCLPFEGVEFYSRQSMRYARKMDVRELLNQAKIELGSNPSTSEEWKALLLCLYAGLSRNELDKLRWNSIDFEAGKIHIEAQADFSPKAESRLGEVPLEPELIGLLRGLRAREPKAVYVLKGDSSNPNAKWRHYRANKPLKRLVAWLRTHGVTSSKPLHELRKEAGSLVCDTAGLFAASRFLRHADVAITAAHYAAEGARPTVGLGALLASAPNVLPFEPAKSEASTLPSNARETHAQSA